MRALWRVWRYPTEGSRLRTVRRVYLLECDTDSVLPTITARMQAELATAGEIDPQVEVCPVRADLPRYQRLARSGGTLMWARARDRGIEMVRLYDAGGGRAVGWHPTMRRLASRRLSG